jgi:hypothetical protein
VTAEQQAILDGWRRFLNALHPATPPAQVERRSA